jgi:hypothetical protein
MLGSVVFSKRYLVGLGLVALVAASCVAGSADDAALELQAPWGRHGNVSMAVVEGDANPPGLTIGLSNPGTCELDFDATATTASGGSWLSVDPVEGILAAAAPEKQAGRNGLRSAA